MVEPNLTWDGGFPFGHGWTGRCRKITVYLTDPRYIDDYRSARNKVLGEMRPTFALLIVQSLFAPAMRVEVEAWAAKS